MPCNTPDPSTTFTVHYDYEMLSTSGASDLASVDAAIDTFASDIFDADCSQGIVGLTSGATDFAGEGGCSALTATESMSCTVAEGYVSVTIDPSLVTQENAQTLVGQAITGGMGSNGAIADGLPDVGLLQMVSSFGNSNSIAESVFLQHDDDIGRKRLTPGGIAGLCLLGLAFVALIVALLYRRQKKRREEKEFVGQEVTEDEEYKRQMMTELDGVVAAVDDEVVKDDDDDGTNSTGSDGHPMSPVNIDAGFVDEASTSGADGKEGEGCGFELSMC